MPFGLRNAPATFSRIVVKLLRDLDDFSGAYLDAIINFSPSWTAHADHLRTVLTRVRDAHLTLSPTKCQFAAAYLDLASPSGYTTGTSTARLPASLLELPTLRERGTFSCPRCSLLYPSTEWADTVYTGHSPLSFVVDGRPQSEAPSWSLELQQYNFNVVHRAGKDNLLADLLSRGSPRE